VNAGPNADAVGRVAAEHLGPLLYALEVCAKAMEQAGRDDDVRYYRVLARTLADAGATPEGTSEEG
jgi:hypothetical protein